MAISNIISRKTMRNRTRQQSMAERHDYDQKAEKTNDGELVSSYMCSPETAAEEFEISKQLYHQIIPFCTIRVISFSGDFISIPKYAFFLLIPI